MNMWHDFSRYEPAYNMPTPPPWWWMYGPPQQPKGGKKGKKSVGKKPNLAEMLKDYFDSREALEITLEKLAKKDKKDDNGKKDDKKAYTFSLWDTMLLLTILALPCSLLQLGIAKAVLMALKVFVNQ